MLRNWLFKNRLTVAGLAVYSAVLLIGGLVLASEPPAAGAEKTAGATYPLETCIVSGAKLGSMGEPVVYEHEGREIRFCCKGCVGRFEKDPATYLEKMDKAIFAAGLEDYPLEVCVVSGDTLGTMGEPVDRVHDNRLVRLCCAGCLTTFDKQPEKYMGMIDEAEETRAAEPPLKPYPLDTCLVSGAKLGSMGEPVTHVYENQEIKLCCAGCIPQFEQDPQKYMKMLKTVETDRLEVYESGGHEVEGH